MKERIIFCLLILNITNCDISNIVWKQESISNISQVNFLNENELIIYSRRGILTKINTNGDTIWKKNLIYPKKCKIESADQCKYC